ncbi:hypothetical protein KCM76_16170 [Zooshikella marina]|uniref:hypothetical protein n=1 Tax=Zooshikella ganghwensis TaxID=202772 RepID=UPI001BAE8C72|nr:hypothetical protein [Zooshikella ganghwensis]MBU2707531.1 hypothetical protein [Zooshikella ganghwensis]
MSKANCLSMMNPTRCSFDHSSKSIRLLTWQDIASALAMGNLNKTAYYIGRIKYCDDKSVIENLIKEVANLFLTHAKEVGWRIKTDAAHKLSQLACLENIRSPICKTCNGTGKIKNETCKSCGGTGSKGFSDASKYKFLCIDKRNWERRWRERYEFIYQIFEDAEKQISKHLANQLSL